MLTGLLLMFSVLFGAMTPNAQNIQRDYDDDNNRDEDDDGRDENRGEGIARVDRYLDVEVWTDQADGEYYEGDNIVIHFRASRDAFVAVYSIDTRGRVNLLFPANSTDDNFVSGGATYRLPDGRDDFDFVVTGPEGRENIQVIASRERFPIPSWHRNSGLVCDWDDRDGYMDDLNSQYFIRYNGQRFAYDRAVVFVNEWEDNYYRPVHYPSYPHWSVCGNTYIDYPYGGSIYVNGIYWGCAPLYIPRILVGWHTITVYDPRGYCWESDFHISRYNTVVFDRHVIRPSRTYVSKYKEVREVGYRDPIRSGYPNYKQRATATVIDKRGVKSTNGGSKSTLSNIATVDQESSLSRKYVRGSTELKKTARGYETNAAINNEGGTSRRSKVSRGQTGSETAGTLDKGRDQNATVETSRDGSYTKRSSYKSSTETVEREGSSGTDRQSERVEKRSGSDADRQQAGRVEKSSQQSGSDNNSAERKQTESKQTEGRKQTSTSTTVKKADGGGSNDKSATSKPQSSGQQSSGKSKEGGGRKK